MKTAQDINTINEVINLIKTEIGEEYAEKSSNVIRSLFSSLLLKTIDLTSENEQLKRQSMQKLNNFFS